jgi:hypothetical protein
VLSVVNAELDQLKAPSSSLRMGTAISERAPPYLAATGLTVRRVVGRCSFLGISCVEPGPTPAVAPKLVSWKSADVVFRHDEPASEGTGTAYGSGCHIFSGRFEHFLHENGAVAKVSVLAIRVDSPRR